MPDVPFVTVLMCVYNGSKFVGEAVESILSQTYRDFEFIIIDDGSTDTSAEIIERYAGRDRRIRFIRMPENIGLTRALNNGLAVSKGKYIARQDADDVSMPDRLARQVEYLEQHPGVAVLGSRATVVDEVGTVQGRLDFPTDHDAIMQSLSLKNVLCHGSVLIRRSVLDEVGSYREFFETSQDRDLWLRVGERFGLANLDAYLLKYRAHEYAVTNKEGDKRKAFKQVILTLSEQRERKGEDDFGLARRGKWEGVPNIRCKMRLASYERYVSGIAKLSRQQYSSGALQLALSMLLYPGNPLARRRIAALVHGGVWKRIRPA